jgi:hypothetical protein
VRRLHRARSRPQLLPPRPASPKGAPSPSLDQRYDDGWGVLFSPPCEPRRPRESCAEDFKLNAHTCTCWLRRRAAEPTEDAVDQTPTDRPRRSNYHHQQRPNPFRSACAQSAHGEVGRGHARGGGHQCDGQADAPARGRERAGQETPTQEPTRPARAPIPGPRPPRRHSPSSIARQRFAHRRRRRSSTGHSGPAAAATPAPAPATTTITTATGSHLQSGAGIDADSARVVLPIPQGLRHAREALRGGRPSVRARQAVEPLIDG